MLDKIIPLGIEENSLAPGEDTSSETAGEILTNALNDGVLAGYREFCATLMKPECALLVQGMRNFLRSLEGSDMNRMASALKSYLETTYESLKSHVAWKDKVDIMVRRSLESFVYGHCHSMLNKLEWTALFSMSEDTWMEHLNQLQFVQPSHLEIACLKNNDLEGVQELLATPMEALLSVDQYFSPFEKLQRILAMYQGVNAALSAALKAISATDDNRRKLPSADDVLPTIILTVVRAKPLRMFRNLQMIEVFCPPEYLRGEAGYAYTNLYGAVQFLHDLDMEKPNSLSISADDFRKGLEECKKTADKRLTAAMEKSEQERSSVRPVDIDVKDVRAARLRGDVVDFRWALNWQQEHFISEQTTGMESTAEEEIKESKLPEGFTRTYSFLTARPEDVRVSDLPHLLAEYRMLVHTTEQLLGDRAARLASEKRRKKSASAKLLDQSILLNDDNKSSRERALTS